jgi:hypothetical protein
MERALLTVFPSVNTKGEATLVIILKRQGNGIFDTTLDGEPAIACALSEDATGSNAPWIFGDLIIENWEKAKKLAEKK